MPTLPEPEGHWEERADNKGRKLRVVNRDGTKLAAGANEERLIVRARQAASLLGRTPLTLANINSFTLAWTTAARIVAKDCTIAK
jgi:hypothetical protein